MTGISSSQSRLLLTVQSYYVDRSRIIGDGPFLLRITGSGGDGSCRNGSGDRGLRVADRRAPEEQSPADAD